MHSQGAGLCHRHASACLYGDTPRQIIPPEGYRSARYGQVTISSYPLEQRVPGRSAVVEDVCYALEWHCPNPGPQPATSYCSHFRRFRHMGMWCVVGPAMVPTQVGQQLPRETDCSEGTHPSGDCRSHLGPPVVWQTSAVQLRQPSGGGCHK